MPLFAWALVLLVASTIITMILMPKPEAPKPAALEEFDFPQFEEGTAQAVFFGDCWTEGWMVLWYGNYRTKEIKSSSGKK
jgi:hypothetical protein